MTAPRRSDREIVSVTITDQDVDEVLAEFGGDPRRAIRALLEDIDTLALDQARTTSHGYLRGRLFRGTDTQAAVMVRRKGEVSPGGIDRGRPPGHGA